MGFGLLAMALGVLAGPLSAESQVSWVIDTQEQWVASDGEKSGLKITEGMLVPSGERATFRSVVKRFDQKRHAELLTVAQSPIWQNWNPVDNLGPANMGDAPVFLAIEPGNYWAFGRYRKARGSKNQPPAEFKPEPATLEGFDVPLQTTPWAKQFDAPGGLKPSKGGYHAWQSKDMVNWVHFGPVTEKFSRWVTSAEYADGKVYIFYDYPNDQDPHVYVDVDLTDGEPGENLGMAFKDPSHGSDAAFIRDINGNFHVIYEDWTPINARKHSWDSPLAGHAVSKTGISDYKILKPAVDERTTFTGKTDTFLHPHWLQHPDWDTNVAEYQVHEPEQEAYGDWAAISIGGQYYLFGDYDPAGEHAMSVGWFTSSDINEQFVWCDHIGNGHPDPDIGFAEGQFYLFTQQQTDYTSPGPWVEKVEVRVGVDMNKDGKLDTWTPGNEVKEHYKQRPGFAKQVDKTPAIQNLESLPAGYGFGFELRLTDTTENKSKPMIDRVTLEWK